MAVPEPALLVLSRARSAPKVVCLRDAAAAGVDSLSTVQVAALLFLSHRGTLRTSELTTLLGRGHDQRPVEAFRRAGHVTLTGRGYGSRLTLTDSGRDLAATLGARLDALWARATDGLTRPRQAAALEALRAVSGRPVEAAASTGFPIDLIVVLDCLTAAGVADVLRFVDQPALVEAALRPLLLLAQRPATAVTLGADLGIGAPGVNVALAPSVRAGLVERHQRLLQLTAAGERIARRITLASDVFWLDVEQAAGVQVRRDAQTLLADLGRGFPASARS